LVEVALFLAIAFLSYSIVYWFGKLKIHRNVYQSPRLEGVSTVWLSNVKDKAFYLSEVMKRADIEETCNVAELAGKGLRLYSHIDISLGELFEAMHPACRHAIALPIAAQKLAVDIDAAWYNAIDILNCSAKTWQGVSALYKAEERRLAAVSRQPGWNLLPVARAIIDSFHHPLPEQYESIKSASQEIEQIANRNAKVLRDVYNDAMSMREIGKVAETTKRGASRMLVALLGDAEEAREKEAQYSEKLEAWCSRVPTSVQPTSSSEPVLHMGTRTEEKVTKEGQEADSTDETEATVPRLPESEHVGVIEESGYADNEDDGEAVDQLGVDTVGTTGGEETGL